MVPTYEHAAGSSNSNTKEELMSGAAVDSGVDGIGSKVGSVSESGGRVDSDEN